MNLVAELTLEAITSEAKCPLTCYASLLRAAFEDHPPAFTQKWYGEKYRSYSVDPLWLCQSLIDNSSKEGEGATKLWGLAGNAEEPSVAEAVRVHAADEARHARLYLGMLRMAFPGSLTQETMEQLYSLTPPFTMKHYPPKNTALAWSTVLDHLIQMNIGEIRTRVHQLLLMPVIQVHCHQQKRERLRGALGSILRDETKHICYTAEIIEAGIAQSGSFVRDLLYQRLQEFNQLTLEEVGGTSFDDE